jgi:hypothetical protein
MATGFEPSAAVRLYPDVSAFVSFLSWNGLDKQLFSEARAGITACINDETLQTDANSNQTADSHTLTASD